MKLLIGTVSLNTRPLTEIFLDTLHASITFCQNKYENTDAELDLQVVVIDNGSNDDVMELSSKYPWATFIRNETNLGVAPAWNQIIKFGFDDFANPLFDYYGIFNNDVFFTTEWLYNFVQCLEQNSDKTYGWISSFMNDYKEPELTGVQETVDLENVYWSIRPHADSVKNKQQLIDVINQAYAAINMKNVDEFSDLLKDKYGIGLKEMHPKAPVFCLSKECIKKVGLFDEWASPIGLHEDADYCERIRRYSNFKFAAAYGAYAHHFSMMTRTRNEFEVPWRTAREENFQQKWLVPSKDMDKLSKNFGIKLEIGSGPKPKTEPNWYHMDVDKNVPHVEFLHDILQPLPFDDETLEEIFCCHNLEHVEWRMTEKILSGWYNKLKSSGKINIRVPNFRYLAEAYLNGSWNLSFDLSVQRNAMHAIFGGDRIGNCFDYHKVGFDYENLSKLLLKIGFTKVVDMTIPGSWELRIEAIK